MKDIFLILHFIGVAMGVGTPIGFMFLGIASSKMKPEEATEFRLNSMALSKMGHIGLVLLFISGGYLMTPYWSELTRMPLLITKLILFLILAALIGIISSYGKKAAKGNTEAYLQKIETLGKLALLIALVIIVFAVLVFH